MKRLPLVLLLLFIAALWLQPAAGTPAVSASGRSPISPALQSALRSQAAGQPVSVIVVLKTQENVRALRGTNRADRKRKVVRALRKRADADQKDLRALLRQLQSAGSVQSFTPLWVMNAIAVTGDRAAIDQLAQSPMVASILADAIIQAPSRTLQTLAASAVAPANLTASNVPSLWSLGYQGQGIVVANMDTGVDSTHPDLAGQWRGGTNSWYDPYGQHAAPTDLNGHGTWTMGVMVGGGASGTTIGVAPRAKWIAVKIFNDSGVASSSAIHLGFQWLLDPDGDPATADAPDVVNNSWALSNPGGCDLSFEPDLQSLVAAGITPVFAAGNYGPNASTSASPSNNPDAFAVGAINNTGTIYNGSSRGPTSCGGSARAYPDLVAPGVSITTTDLYGFYYSATGTSLAAPQAAGTLALLLSANPDLTVAEQRSALLNGAIDLGVAGVDNTFGVGRIDALSAYNTLAAAQPTPTAQPTDLPSATPTLQPTSTPGATSTALPADTPTATAMPTSTPAATPSATATSTPTAVPTNTPTSTATATALPSATATATRTPTALPSATATALPSATPTRTATATATPVGDTLFADGFEGGGLSAWSAAAAGSGRLSVTSSAALVGTRGMQAQVSSTSGIYVTDNAPANEASYHARFYFNPNGASTGTGQHDILIGRNSAGTTILRVQYQRIGSGTYTYQIRAGATRNGGTTYTNWQTISSAAHPIEIAWQSNSSASFSLYIDGTLKQTLANLNTSAYTLDSIRLGPSSISSNSAGTEYFDAFASTRATYIGP